MKNPAIDAPRQFSWRWAILVLALLWGADAARAVPEEVTAIKGSAGELIADPTFTIMQGQPVVWRATFTGSPTQGHSFYVNRAGTELWEFIVNRPQNGTYQGTQNLNAGTYHISIVRELMGPGTYTIRYDPTGDGHDNADPHLTTVNGVRYDFQSAGEFVVLRGRSGMEIQARQTPLPTLPPVADVHSGLTVGVALNSAVAARVNDHRVTYQMGPLRPAGAPPALELRVDGVPTVLRPNGLVLGPGGRLSPAPNGIRIDFPDGTVLVVTSNFWPLANLWYLNLDVFRTPAREGIMGPIEGRSWLPALPDGSGLGPRPDSAQQRYADLYGRFADAWRVTDRTSLFDYERGTSTATFTLAGWPGETGPVAVAGRAVARPLGAAAARRACSGIARPDLRQDCIFDVQVTGDPIFARGYRLAERVRGGTTATSLECLPDRSNGAGPATFAATVSRLARSGRAALAGRVQFIVDGVASGTPVRLGAGGRASWQAPRLDAGEHRIAARYRPAAGSVFLPSESVEVAHIVRQGY